MHTALAIDLIGSQRDQTGESPLWSPSDQALYWVDITGQQLRRYNWATRSVQSWYLKRSGFSMVQLPSGKASSPPLE